VYEIETTMRAAFDPCSKITISTNHNENHTTNIPCAKIKAPKAGALFEWTRTLKQIKAIDRQNESGKLDAIPGRRTFLR
jgi:hypothetical protein